MDRAKLMGPYDWGVNIVGRVAVFAIRPLFRLKGCFNLN